MRPWPELRSSRSKEKQKMRILMVLVAACMVTRDVNAEPSNSSVAAGPSRCPYDFTVASRLIPKSCYQNYTDPSVNSQQSTCCWFVYASYMYSIIEHANKTGIVYLDSSRSKTCANEFVRYVKYGGLVRSRFFHNNSQCVLKAGDFTAGSGPCRYGNLQEIWNSVDLTEASKACTALDAQNGTSEEACNGCQVAVEQSTLRLIGLTESKQTIPCGMAATVGIWGKAPSETAYTAYFHCTLQVLENLGNLNLVPILFPPLPAKPEEPRPAAKNSRDDNNTERPPNMVGATVGGASAVALLALVALYIFRSGKLQRHFGSGETVPRTEDTKGARRKLSMREALPTEGLYIFTRRELKVATQNFHSGRVLGEGGSGKVYLGRLPSGKQVAIKRIVQEKKLDEFYQEVELLSKLRHPNLTSLLGYCLHRNEHILVYEYMPGGDLARLLYDGGPAGCGFPWLERLRIGMDCAEGLVYLHEFPEGAIIHRDIKPTNILLNQGGQAKLSDFGVSKIIATDFSHVSTEIKGTTGYLDPEYFSVGQLTEASDVYSFGIVLLELVSGRRAIVNTPSGGAESIVYATHMLMRNENPDLRKLIDPRIEGVDVQFESIKKVLNLAYRCVQPYRSERPSMLEVVAALRDAWATVMSIPGDDPSDSPCNLNSAGVSAFCAEGALSSQPVVNDQRSEGN